jgi:hypothetical protein
MMKKRIVNLLFLLLTAAAVQAQSFTHSLALPKPDSAGYYEIELPIEVFSVCNKKQGDIRIYEAGTKTAVPYILRKGDDGNTRFKEMELPVDFEVKSNRKNRYEIFIPPFDAVSYSELKFKYSSKSKFVGTSTAKVLALLNYAKGEGVEKTEIVFNIREYAEDSIFILSHGSIAKGQATQIVFENMDANFEITGISYKKTIEDYTVFTQLSNLAWETTENVAKKTSVIKGTFPFTVPILKMEIEIDSTGYYNRFGNISLYTEKKRSLFDGEHRSSFSVDFREGDKVSVDAAGNIANRFLITINNKDNKPLPIKSITAYAQKLYVVARLEAGKQYVLMAGNPTLRAPHYDWDYNYYMPKSNCVVANAALLPIEQGENKNGLLLWGAVGLCIVVMGGMAFSMIKRTTANN